MMEDVCGFNDGGIMENYSSQKWDLEVGVKGMDDQSQQIAILKKGHLELAKKRRVQGQMEIQDDLSNQQYAQMGWRISYGTTMIYLNNPGDSLTRKEDSESFCYETSTHQPNTWVTISIDYVQISWNIRVISFHILGQQFFDASPVLITGNFLHSY